MGLVMAPLLKPFPRRFHNRTQFGIFRLPTQNVPNPFGTRHQNGGITRSPRTFHNGNRQIGNLFATTNYIPDRVPSPGADVQTARLPTGSQVIQGEYMSMRQVFNMDVVSDAGSIVGIVIGTEDG